MKKLKGIYQIIEKKTNIRGRRRTCATRGRRVFLEILQLLDDTPRSHGFGDDLPVEKKKAGKTIQTITNESNRRRETNNQLIENKIRGTESITLEKSGIDLSRTRLGCRRERT